MISISLETQCGSHFAPSICSTGPDIFSTNRARTLVVGGLYDSLERADVKGITAYVILDDGCPEVLFVFFTNGNGIHFEKQSSNIDVDCIDLTVNCFVVLLDDIHKS